MDMAGPPEGPTADAGSQENHGVAEPPTNPDDDAGWETVKSKTRRAEGKSKQPKHRPGKPALDLVRERQTC